MGFEEKILISCSFSHLNFLHRKSQRFLIPAAAAAAAGAGGGGGGGGEGGEGAGAGKRECFEEQRKRNGL